MLVQRILYNRETHCISLFIYIHYENFLSHYICEIRFVFDHLSILDICKFVVPQQYNITFPSNVLFRSYKCTQSYITRL